MSGTVPSDYDDHHGRAARSHSHCTRLWRRRRSPQTAGIGSGRRPDAFATGDVVSDAGGVHVHGVAAGKVELTATGDARTGTYVFALGFDELLGNIHPASDRYQFTDGSYRAFRCSGLSGTSRE